MRRAPTAGYGFARKRDYRRRVWAAFRDTCKLAHFPVAEQHAALMPSLEGDEVEVALNAGFREQHLHVIDDNPAIVAVLKRRYSRINTYGVDVVRALARIGSAGYRLRCANFDFTSQLSLASIATIQTAMATGILSGAFHESVLVALTTLCGREAKDVIAAIRKQAAVAPGNLRAMLNGPDDMARRSATEVLKLRDDNDRARAMFLGISLTGIGCDMGHMASAHAMRCSTYVSVNGQKMLWSVWACTCLIEPVSVSA